MPPPAPQGEMKQAQLVELKYARNACLFEKIV